MYIHSNNTKLNNKGYSLNFYMIIFIFLYALFALNRIKLIFSLNVENISTTNEIWIIISIFFLSFFSNKTDYVKTNKYNFYFGIVFYMLCLIIIIGAFNSVSISQFVYASLTFVTPFLLFYVSNKSTREEIKFLFKMFVFICLVYSIFAILLTTNYAFFMKLVGNPIDNYINYSQYRASMMLGSSITVSYYFNITLPFCFYLFYNSKESKWRRISALAIGTNIVATLILLSRNATVVMVFIVLYNIFL